MSDPLHDDSWAIQDGITFSILQNPLRTRIHTTGPKFEAPSHWHAAHDEVHVVIKGRLIITQDGVRRVVGPEDGPCFTRRGVVHSLETFPGEETIIEETATVPEATEQKTIFFRNMSVPGVMQSFPHLMQVFYYGDMYPKLPTGLRWLETPLVVVVGGWIAPIFGYRLPDKRLRLDPRRFPPKRTE